MGLRINQNIAAMNAYRNLSVNDTSMSKSLEKLSSGYRINRAADDAAGLSVSEGLRAQVGGLKVAVRNAQDGISVVQTAEGALTEVHSILQRMRDLAVQASNSGSQDSEAVSAAQGEIDGLVDELDRIGNTTSFGTKKLFNGSYGQSHSISSTLGVFAAPTPGAAADLFTLNALDKDGNALAATVDLSNVATDWDTVDEAVAKLNQSIRAALVEAGGQGDEVGASYVVDPNGGGGQFKLTSVTGAFSVADTEVGSLAEFGLAVGASSLTGSGGVFQVGANNSNDDRITVNIGTVNSTSLGVSGLNLASDANGAIDDLDDAIEQVSSTRADLGAYQNRFEHTINNLNVAIENLSASESRIRDTDMAQEMVSFTRSQILSQAGTAMLAQANQAPQSVLQLLR